MSFKHPHLEGRNRGFGKRRKPDSEYKGMYRKLDGAPAHRILVEQRIGMILPPTAVVHHVDPTDKLTNKGLFVVCENQAYHALLEIRGRALRACGNANWRKCWKCGEYDDPKNLIITSVPSYPERDMVRHKQFRWKCVPIDFDTTNRRVALARTEGIWEATAGDREVRCILCGMVMSASPLTRVTHGKMHVRQGTAVATRVPAICARKGMRTLHIPADKGSPIAIHASSDSKENA